MALIVLDASVVIALLDPVDAHHTAAVTTLDTHAGDDMVLPASSYAEALVHPTRQENLGAARSRLAALLIRVEPIDERIAEQAALLRAQQPALRLPDALVLACGETLEADAVLTTDRRWRAFSRVRLVG